MTIRAIWTIPFLAALVCVAVPAAGQQGPPQGGPPPGAPPPEAVERLEKVRMERMRAALELTEREVEAIRARMEEHREQMRDALEAQRRAMERLHEALREEPVDQQQVARALEAVERERDRTRTVRDRHRDEVGHDLSPEKRAKMMLFNERFERRLRELMAGRNAPGIGRPTPGRAPGPRAPQPGVPHRPEDAAPSRGADLDDAERIRRRIERLEAEIERLRDRLESLEEP